MVKTNEQWRNMDREWQVNMVHQAMYDVAERLNLGNQTYNSAEEGFKGEPEEHLHKEVLDALVYSYKNREKMKELEARIYDLEATNINIDFLADEVHNVSKSKGFYDNPRSIVESLALIHSEVSEAVEAIRNDDETNFREELADIIIRTLDLSAYTKIDIGHEILKKIRKNKSRPHMHGGKAF